MFCPAILMIFIYFEDFFKNLINKPLFSILVNVTYSTYLIHAPLTIILILIFGGNKVYLSPVFFVVYFSTLIFLSIYVYYLIEKKIQNKIRSIYNKK